MINYEKFNFWCQRVLPIVYDDSLSMYEVISKAVDYLNKLIDEQKEIVDMISPFGTELTELKTEVDFVSEELTKVKNGDYVSLYLDSLSKWIDSNLTAIVSRVVKFVAFELDDSGRLIAYIPDTWDFLKFDTDVNTESANYGHLILEW
jgi:hypothetical protein